MKATVLRMVGITLAIVLLGIFSFTQTSYAEALGWSQEHANRWQQMRQENHPIWIQLQQASIERDEGIVDGLMYLITGDSGYAQEAWGDVDHYRGRTYNTSGAVPDRNATRHNFIAMSTLYSWISNALPSQDKANFRDILDYWSDLVFSPDHGTRTSDSDELTGHYVGVVLYALAIQGEDPQRADELLNFAGNSDVKPVGGLDSTGVNRDTWRNTISDYIVRAQGGQWLESPQYNLNTIRYLMQGVSAVNSHLGLDKFPEVTAEIENYSKALVEELTPTLTDSFQWGDIQDNHGLTYKYRLSALATISNITKDPRALYALDIHAGSYTGNPDPFYYLNVDVYSPRTEPSGKTVHSAPGRGLAYFHEGWEENDSFFASWHQTTTGVDHQSNAETNFRLFRNGHWAINHPVGYLGDSDPPYNNNMIISGGIDYCKEARGESGVELGDNYAYHVGVTGGQTVMEGYYNPPPETVHEWTRSFLYLHNDNDSDTVLIFDRIDADDPLTDIETWQFERLRDEDQRDILNAEGQHQWIIHMPDSNPTISGNITTWHDEAGEEVKLISYLSSDYSTAVFDELVLHNQGLNPDLRGTIYDEELKYQMRIMPTQTSGWQTLLNVVHMGSDIVTERIQETSGENVEGVLANVGIEKMLVIFNATEGPYLEPTPKDGSRAAHNPEKHSDLAQLRYFQSGYNLNLSSFGDVSVYLMDLDPVKQWFVDISGYEMPLEVSDVGIARFTYAEVGDHYLSVYAFGEEIPPEGGEENNPPQISIIGDTMVSEEETVTLFVNASDADSDPVILSSELLGGAAVETIGASFVDNGNGTGEFSWTPAIGQSGTYNILFSASDGDLEDSYSATIIVSTPQDFEYDLMLSYASDRSNSAYLTSRVIAGDVYVFVGPDDSMIDEVRFYLDDSDQSGDPMQTEGREPFDFAGTASDGTAYVFDTSTIVDGTHTITASVTLNDQSIITTSADFVVENISDPVCGNNILEEGEECDDSNAVSGDGCSETCVAEYCGDRVAQASLGEECDDGNTVSGDGCSDTCISEYCGDGIVSGEETCDSDSQLCVTSDGYVGDQFCNNICTGFNVCTSTLYCGDGTVNGNEVCDSESQACVTNSGYEGTQTCDNSCSGFSNCVSTLYCGDGTVDGSEECDDGNAISGDGCSDACVVEVLEVNADLMLSYASDRSNSSYLMSQTVAGNVYVFVGSDDSMIDEVRFYLDDSSQSGDPMQTEGREPFDFAGTASDGTAYVFDTSTIVDGTHTITASVTLNDQSIITTSADFVVENISDPVCGNNILEKGEECDDGNTVSGDGCTEICALEPADVCGDDICSESESSNLCPEDCGTTFENHWLEAENADTMVSPLEIRSDTNTSENEYIFTPYGSSDYYDGPSDVMATYTVTIEQEGEYILWSRVYARRDKNDSFYVQIDSGNDITWEIPVYRQWHWTTVQDQGQQAPNRFYLRPGVHTIKIKAREDGTKIDKLFLTNELSNVPTGLGDPAEN